MSQIRVIYEREPRFPATDQHPDAIRYRIGNYFVDAIGGEPLPQEVHAILNQPNQKSIHEQIIDLRKDIDILKTKP